LTSIFTGWATTNIKITQQTMLMFVAPQGQHHSRIRQSVKFGTAEGTEEVSRWEADIWAFPPPPPKKKRKIAKIANFIAPQGRTHRCW